MTDCENCHGQLADVRVGQLVAVETNGAFGLAPGHPLRATRCLVCQDMIGKRPAAIIGVAVIEGETCPGSCVQAQMYLIHAHCYPDNAGDLAAALQQAALCDRPHSWQQ